MQIRFTKLTPTHHTFEIVRTDGSREEAELETKSFMPHDLIHLAYESTAGLKESFFGKLAAGTTLAEFGDREIMSRPENADTQMVMTERVTGPLSGYLEKGVSEEAFLSALENMASASAFRLPEFITPNFLQQVKARYRGLIGEWRSLPHHKTMIVEWQEAY